MTPRIGHSSWKHSLLEDSLNTSLKLSTYLNAFFSWGSHLDSSNKFLWASLDCIESSNLTVTGYLFSYRTNSTAFLWSFSHKHTVPFLGCFKPCTPLIISFQICQDIVQLCSRRSFSPCFFLLWAPSSSQFFIFPFTKPITALAQQLPPSICNLNQ